MAISKKLKDLGVEDALHNLKGITQGMLVVLGEKNIKKASNIFCQSLGLAIIIGLVISILSFEIL